MALARERAVITVLTHPYEGGHPDHDATCLTVHAAAALLTRMHATRLHVAEMAFYSERGGRFIAHRFVDEPADGSTELRLGNDDWSRKRRMLAAFASQQSMLETFGGRIVRLRPAPTYDFACLPNGGELHYARFIANPDRREFSRGRKSGAARARPAEPAMISTTADAAYSTADVGTPPSPSAGAVGNGDQSAAAGTRGRDAAASDRHGS